MPVLADHRDVKPPELIGTQQALRGKAHRGTQGQHVVFAGPQHPGDPGGVGQLPVPPHQLENTIGKMRLGNGLERGSGRFAGAAEAESQRTQVKKFPAVHGLPFRPSGGLRVAARFSGSRPDRMSELAGPALSDPVDRPVSLFPEKPNTEAVQGQGSCQPRQGRKNSHHAGTWRLSFCDSPSRGGVILRLA